MNNKDIEKLFAKDDFLTPPANLKAKIINQTTCQNLSWATEKEGKKHTFPLFKRLIAVCASVIFVFLIAFSSVAFYNEKYETIYVDINPSIALNINRFEIVVGVDYLNEDSKTVFSTCSIEGSKIENAVIVIMNKLQENDYFTEDAELFISGYSNNSENAEKTVNKLLEKAEQEKNKNNYNIKVNCVKIDKEDNDKSIESGISPTKLALIKQILAKSDDYSPEDLNNMNLKQLKAIFDNLQDDHHGDNGGNHNDERPNRNDEDYVGNPSNGR